MSNRMHIRTLGWLGLTVPVVIAALAVGAGYQAGKSTTPLAPDKPPTSPTLYAVVINAPSAQPVVHTGEFDAQGNEITVNCTTCHATRTANTTISDGQQLEDFHTGLYTNHGGLSCLSCHNADDYSALHRANGETLSFAKTKQLCAQCHGPQHRDYTNGSHGGMNGYWDLSKGGRTRNTCTNCHDPHAPQYPTVMPVFRPKDRFLNPPIKHHTPAQVLIEKATHGSTHD
jgi:hypothetical protein